jgi:hypothetical protein
MSSTFDIFLHRSCRRHDQQYRYQLFLRIPLLRTFSIGRMSLLLNQLRLGTIH